LSGGAVATGAPGGAPTFWNSESAWGRSTTPATLTLAAGWPVRPMATVSPGLACRFAAVCWASRTPVPLPVSVRSSPGNAFAYPGGRPSTNPGPVLWTLPAVFARKPVASANPTGSATFTPGKLRVAASTFAADVPRWVSTCQSTDTREMARSVILRVVAERKVPIEARVVTVTATPMATANSVPRRWAMSPRIQVSETMPRPSPS